MPDGTFTLDRLTTQGDTIAVEYTTSGTQAGDLALPTARRLGVLPTHTLLGHPMPPRNTSPSPDATPS
ncbi:hypothetical protein [Streptomyces sp. NPDC057403]|uniref:hypothetical protein n=1 Tax=Streptomyces sp. NPDC057403 TaxID=3346119 RepID=UPI0036A563EB